MEQQEEISEHSSQKAGYLSTFFNLYLAQAVPMSFFTTALQVILREQAVPLSLIGLLQIVKLPWILKVFWSPAIDRHCHTIRDYKRTIIGAEIVYALLILVTSLFDLHTILPLSFHLLIVLILLALAASATQDIATDAWPYALRHLINADCSTACSRWAALVAVFWAAECS